MIVKRNFPRLVRKLALLTILVFFAYQLLLFYDSRHKHEKNEEVKAVIVQEKLREKLEQIQKEADKPEVRISRKIYSTLSAMFPNLFMFAVPLQSINNSWRNP